jgi:uncharacterized membrane protein (UPF0136 family)
MSWLQIVVLVYGVVMGLGGTMAYMKVGSKESLVTGIVSAILLVGGAVSAGSHPRVGFGLSALVTVGLIVVFVRRCMETGWAPRNIGLLVLSAVVLVLLVVGHFMKGSLAPKAGTPNGGGTSVNG